jgi:hypothetical protein
VKKKLKNMRNLVPGKINKINTGMELEARNAPEEGLSPFPIE